MHRFYAPDFIDDADVSLPEEEARHLARVLRLKPGDEIAIFDGKGREAMARVTRIAGGTATVRPVAPRQPVTEAKYAMTLAQALLKSDKMDGVIRDAVMLGVSAVQPFVSRRTDVPRTALRTGVRQQRWERTAISSVKQCGRAVVPAVLDPVDFDTLVKATGGRTRVMFVEPSAAESEVTDLRSLERTMPLKPVIIIGPEGGWEVDEVAAARDAGVTLVTLRGATLRADAAGGIALAVLRYIWQDL